MNEDKIEPSNKKIKLGKASLNLLFFSLICLCLCGIHFFYSYIDPFFSNKISYYIENYYLSSLVNFLWGFFIGVPYLLFFCFGIEIMCDKWVEQGKLLYLALVSYGGIVLCAWYFDVYKFISGFYNFFIFFGEKENMLILKELIK